ncbi:glutamine--fructose-6-phosphate transaminase (isomerizing) [Carboxydochorda subterranea]|uniref:Glutamine--fructose-6-phosphate aminotransferase [isomerizing] n=1 Tax=Carboxydichorda subterranea TaxID=3109565 RepID=A0ABZ1BUD5_9FIRM|nr:glutamine--fructose-6-phosphate transaminase (isomerizing) [Limnochorda sp. L945t]WRP16384.1 glutamine--fructose-6-phosphate transaminase (isomerizing) [Limnochorda sp. L945t]
MCGIVGYVGNRPALPILLEGLRRLEYRGYDSAGVAVVNHRLQVVKSQGRVEQLERLVASQGLEGRSGIGHTRWATHGAPSDHNAHPHTDCSGRFAVVHNGILDNFAELRKELEARGHRFRSDTDTEVVAHLLEEAWRGDLAAALREVTRRLRGSWALACVCTDQPDTLALARQDSPLVIGVGDGQYVAGSDVTPVLATTRRVLYLDNGEVARIDLRGVTIWDARGEVVGRSPVEVAWDASAAEKGSFDHFMMKEIYEQPQAVRQTLAGRVDPAAGSVDLSGAGLSPDRLRSFERIQIVACGTAWHAGLVGRRLIEAWARLPVQVDVASEFRYGEPLVDGRTLTVAISQSGETADTLAAVREARRLGSPVLGIVNVEGSSLAREADWVLTTKAGPEVAVPSTKAYLTQVVALHLLALALSRVERPEEGRMLLQLPQRIEQTLAMEPRVRELARQLAGQSHLFYIGRGLDYAVAMEGALKLKEISYIHAEAYAAGELKHGTLALIEPGRTVVALATQEALRTKTVGNMVEVKARGGRVVAVTPDRPDARKEVEVAADALLALPDAPEGLLPVLAAVPLQMLAYFAAVERGCDVDRPRNLAKSVTVE